MLALYELNPPVSFVHYTLTNILAYTETVYNHNGRHVML